jgi:uroporphyrinogen decarboxylase
MPTDDYTRERDDRAIRRQVPDACIDMGGFQTGSTAWPTPTCWLTVNEARGVTGSRQQIAVPCEAVLQRLHVDTRYLVAHGPQSFEAEIVRAEREGKAWQDLRDEWGVVWSMPEDQGLYMDITHHPLADATVADLDEYPFPDGGDPSRFGASRAGAGPATDPYAICTGIGGVVYEICWYMRGLERWYVDTVENPAFCAALLTAPCSTGWISTPLPR